MAKHVLGVDHGVVMVRDLDAARDTWARLGFTLTPRGLHSAHVGTGNHCIMFAGDYLELLGVLTPTEHNLAWRQALARREGLSAVALRTDDAAAAGRALAGAGFDVSRPLDFARPVELPDGRAEAAFTIVQLALEAEAGVQSFVCQHHTPQNVWRPQWQAHENGAEALAGLTLAVADPATVADTFARLFGAEAVHDGSGRLAVATGSIPLHVLGPAALADGYPGVELPPQDDLPQAVAIAIRVADVQATAALLRRRGVTAVRLGHRLCVAADEANGTILEFVEHA